MSNRMQPLLEWGRFHQSPQTEGHRAGIEHTASVKFRGNREHVKIVLLQQVWKQLQFCSTIHARKEWIGP